MTASKIIFKEKLFYWLLTFVVITIPFPAYSLNSQAIIGFILSWIFFNSINEKRELLHKNLISFLILSIPFWLSIIGVFYTNNLDQAINDIVKKLPFLIFPLTLLSVKLHNKTINFIANQFCNGVFIAILLALLKAAYFKIFSLGNYYYYDKLSILLNKHTTYFALFIVISILFVFNGLITKNIGKIKGILYLITYSLLLYMLSVRISFIALSLGIIVLSYYNLNRKYVLGISAILIVSLAALFFSPNVQKRFANSTTDNAEISDIEFRKKHWISVIESITHNSILIGEGTGSTRDFLYKKYKEKKLTSAYDEEYNAHNQYLEVILNNGFIGILLFILFLSYIILNFIKNKNTLGIAILVVLCVFMLTESILERHSGVIVFSLFLTLILKENHKKIINIYLIIFL